MTRLARTREYHLGTHRSSRRDELGEVQVLTMFLLPRQDRWRRRRRPMVRCGRGDVLRTARRGGAGNASLLHLEYDRRWWPGIEWENRLRIDGIESEESCFSMTYKSAKVTSARSRKEGPGTSKAKKKNVTPAAPY